MVDVASDLKSALAGRYEVGDELGRGGTAIVFRARDLARDRDVAVKVLRRELAAFIGRERFLREIRILARLSHPGILPLIDSGELAGAGGPCPWFVMPYVAGESLRARLRREAALPVDRAVAIALEIADALGYAHGHGVVHRDVKPENVLLDGERVVVADFGIARALDRAATGDISSSGLVIGTPAYMSPEQATGHGKVDGRTDLYGLGCVLYEMLAGRPPFTGSTPQAVVARHLTDPPPPVRTLRPAVPERVERVVMRALAKLPADRYRDAADFMAALDPRAPEPAEHWWSRSRLAGLLARVVHRR